MATVSFNWSEERFDECSLRTLTILIEQHEKTERNKAKAIGFMTACYTNGKDPEEFMVEDDPVKVRRKEFDMGHNMW